MAVHSAHHFYNFNQLVSGFIAQNKKVTNNVHLMKFENLKTCGSLWGNNSNSTHVDWWTAKHHFSRPRHKQDCNPRGPGMRIVVYTRNLLPVSRPRGQPSRYLELSIVLDRRARWLIFSVLCSELDQLHDPFLLEKMCMPQSQ